MTKVTPQENQCRKQLHVTNLPCPEGEEFSLVISEKFGEGLFQFCRLLQIASC